MPECHIKPPVFPSKTRINEWIFFSRDDVVLFPSKGLIFKARESFNRNVVSILWNLRYNRDVWCFICIQSRILTCNNGQILDLLTKEIHKDFHIVNSTTKICYIIKIFLESLIREYMVFKTILTTTNLNQNELLYKKYKHHEINTCMRPKLLYIKLNKYLIPFQFLDCINVVNSFLNLLVQRK